MNLGQLWLFGFDGGFYSSFRLLTEPRSPEKGDFPVTVLL